MMKVSDDWLRTEEYDKAEEMFVGGLLDKAQGEITMNTLAIEASWDAGFEAGVLAQEAGVGRYSD
jgi:hypothetical protein